MRFSILSAFAFVAAVVAQTGNKHNAFNLPTDGTLVINAGQTQQLTWSNKAGNTVSLYLRNGLNSDLKPVLTIAENIANSGAFTWNVPSTLAEGNSYAISIVNGDDTSDINYTSQFVIRSDVKAIASGTLTTQVTATSASLVTSMPSGVTVTSGSASGSASGMTTMTGSSTGTAASSTGTNASSSSSRAGSTSATSAAAGTVPTNAAARPAAGAAGALLAVAAGFAIAL